MEAAKTNFSAKVRAVFGLDLHSWEQLMLWALGAVALAGAAVVWTTASVVMLTRAENARTKAEFEQYKIDAAAEADAKVGVAREESKAAIEKSRSEAETKIEVARGEAKAAVEKAQADIEVARAEAAKANLRAAELQKDTASAEADNLALQTSLRPRRLSFVGWTDHPERISGIYDELKKFSGTTAFIQVVPDFEAKIFAEDIARVLADAGWKPRFVDAAESHLSESSFPEGVALFTLTDGKSQTGAGTAVWSALTEADVLMSGTGTFGAYVPHKIIDKPADGDPYFDPPVTAVLIRVGLKPFTSQFLEIQRRNMDRQDTRMDRFLRQAYEQNGKPVLFGLPDRPAVAATPTGPNGEWIAVNPAEQSLLPKRASPTLVLPGGVMLRSSPPDAAGK